MQTANPSWTTYELVLRYSFLATTVAITVRYLCQLSKLSLQMWGYQQRWILVLLIFLALFDGPLAAPRIYTVKCLSNRANKRVLRCAISKHLLVR